MKIQKPKIGILIIASYFMLDGLYISYQLVNIYLYGQHAVYNLIVYLIPLGFILSGLGLYLHKGWGRYFALLSCFSYIYIGLSKITIFLSGKYDIWDFAKVMPPLIFAISTLLYLCKKSIKESFPDNPTSLLIIGTILSIYGFTQHSDYSLIDVLWRLMAIVGLVIIVKAARQLKKSMGIIPPMGF